MVKSDPAKNGDQANKLVIKTLPARQLINRPGVGALTMMSKQRCEPGPKLARSTKHNAKASDGATVRSQS